ncbi:single-stranded DNA-binding protein [uncultured Dialister sp.]|jgi:single-strand DNA-binding protein|uniref:single-stranded DNA-binding protein n=1 Tax=uncultured Dialister sp. TaxID=278064 RepID=UPI0025CD63E0|nr:single-stranded DNA-binding protein [uncultured Dialister sp.]
MNSVQILGNLGRDPIIRATKTGRSVASFSVAVSRNYTTPQGEQRELTDWINVVAWGPLAEAVGNQLKKGSRVFVEGRISSRSYDAQDGTKRYVTEVVANTIAVPIGTPRSSSYGPQQGGSFGGGFGGNNGGFGGNNGGFGGNGYNNGGNGGYNNSPAGQGGQPGGNFGQFGTTSKDEDIPF